MGHPAPAPTRTAGSTTDTNSAGQLHYRTAEDQTYFHPTEYFYGVTRGTGDGDSRVASNDLVRRIRWAFWPTWTDDDYAYNAQGEQIWNEDPSGTEHVYDYDSRGRQIHDRATVLAAGVDGAVRRISTTYDALDRTLSVSTCSSAAVGSGSVVNDVQYEYEKFGVLKTIYQEWAGAVNTGTSPKVSYAWSFPTDGTTGLRRTSTTYPDSTVITDVYNSGTDDALSRLSGRKNGSTWVFQDSHLGTGRLVERRYGETSYDLRWTLIQGSGYTLDTHGRISTLRVDWVYSTDVNTYLYSYNWDSRMSSRADTVGTSWDDQNWDEQFWYDDLGRLTGHQRGDSGDYLECFTRESFGNVEEYYTGAASTCGSGTLFEHNSLNEITDIDSEANTWTGSGELTEVEYFGRQYDYDAWGRLVEERYGSSNVIASYQYNGLGQKVARLDSLSGLEDTYYYYSAESQVLEEAKVADGSKLCSYVWGPQNVDDIVQRIGSTSGSEEWYALDANNNVVTKFGSTGSVAARYVYDAYGNPSQIDWSYDVWETIEEDQYLFTGRQYHVDGGQYDYRARWLDPELGIFTSRDPIGIWGDPAAFGNGYLYAAGDPVNFVDPFGMDTRFYHGGRWWHEYRLRDGQIVYHARFNRDDLDRRIANAEGRENGWEAVHFLVVEAGTTIAVAAAPYVVGGCLRLPKLMRDVRRLRAARQNTANMVRVADRVDPPPHIPDPSVSPAAPRGGVGPVNQGKAGVGKSIRAAEARGERVLGEEITVELPSGRRSRPDLVTDGPGGRTFVESKNGPGAQLTPNQCELRDTLNNGGNVIPRGANAEAAGLTPGNPVGGNFRLDRH